jgi:hypothetical protein
MRLIFSILLPLACPSSLDFLDRTNAAALGAAFSALRSASEGVSDIDAARNPKVLNCTEHSCSAQGY